MLQYQQEMRGVAGSSSLFIDTDYYEVQLERMDLGLEAKKEIKALVKRQKLIKNVVTKGTFGTSEEVSTNKEILEQEWEAPQRIQDLQNDNLEYDP